MNLEQCNNAKKFLFWIITNTCTVIVMPIFVHNGSKILMQSHSIFFTISIFVNKHSQYLDTNIFVRFEHYLTPCLKGSESQITNFLELIFEQKIYSQLTLVLKT